MAGTPTKIVVLNCKECDAQFTRGKSNSQKFCSPQCRLKHDRKARIARWEGVKAK